MGRLPLVDPALFAPELLPPPLPPLPPPPPNIPPLPPLDTKETDTQEAILRSPVLSASQTLIAAPTFISAMVPCFPLDPAVVFVVGAFRDDPIHALLCPPPGRTHPGPPGNPPPPRVLISTGTPTGIVTSTSIFFALVRASCILVIRAFLSVSDMACILVRKSALRISCSSGFEVISIVSMVNSFPVTDFIVHCTSALFWGCAFFRASGADGCSVGVTVLVPGTVVVVPHADSAKTITVNTLHKKRYFFIERL